MLHDDAARAGLDVLTPKAQYYLEKLLPSVTISALFSNKCHQRWSTLASLTGFRDDYPVERSGFAVSQPDNADGCNCGAHAAIMSGLCPSCGCGSGLKIPMKCRSSDCCGSFRPGCFPRGHSQGPGGRGGLDSGSSGPAEAAAAYAATSNMALAAKGGQRRRQSLQQ